MVAIGTTPAVGIGQTAQLVVTPSGSLLWDPTGYIDEATVARIAARGPVLGIAASHPHMFGVQIEWARALDAPVLVCEADREWLGRTDDRVIGNFDNAIDTDGRAVLRRSAERHIAWVRGDFDHLT